MSETLDDKIARLDALTKTPVRAPMSRSQQFPSMASQHIATEQEIVRLRSALSEAVAIIVALRHYDERDEG